MRLQRTSRDQELATRRNIAKMAFQFGTVRGTLQSETGEWWMIGTILVHLFEGDRLEQALEGSIEPLSCCGRAHYETEPEALNDCRDRSQQNGTGLSALVHEQTNESSRCDYKKKILGSRLAGGYDTWQNQQWERALQLKRFISGQD